MLMFIQRKDISVERYFRDRFLINKVKWIENR